MKNRVSGGFAGVSRWLLMAIGLAGMAAMARADAIAVNNASFEQLPAGGLSNSFCGGLCNYSDYVALPGWTYSGSSDWGEWLGGPTNGAYNYWNSIPDGNNILFFDGGTVSQTTSATVQAGVTYTLQVDLGERKDLGDPGVAYLVIGGSTLIQATGTAPTAGNWANYTATYTGTAGTAGQSIGIEFATSGAQADFDNVRLASNASVPEPASVVLLLGVMLCLLPALRKLRHS